MHYKAPDNSLHYLDDDKFSYLLPAGSVAITDAEAVALRPIPVVDTKGEAKAYLASTDWYVVRFAETGKAVPAEITGLREAARVAASED